MGQDEGISVSKRWTKIVEAYLQKILCFKIVFKDLHGSERCAFDRTETLIPTEHCHPRKRRRSHSFSRN